MQVATRKTIARYKAKFLMIKVLKYWNRCQEGGENPSVEVFGPGRSGGVGVDDLQGSFQHT